MFGTPPIKQRGLLSMLGAMPMGQQSNLGALQTPQGAAMPMMQQEAQGYAQMAPQAPQRPKGPGFFGEGGTGRSIAGAIGDYLLQLNHMQPIYSPVMQQRQAMQQRQQMMEQQRQADWQDWQKQFDYTQAHKAPPQPHYWESNDGSLMALGQDGKPYQVYKDPTPRMQFIPDGMGGGQFVPITMTGEAAAPGMPTAPVGKLTIIGDGSGNATGGFPKVTGNRLDHITVQAESAGNPNAVSPKGARGLWQVMPGTARDPGFGIKPSNGTPQDDARVGQQYRVAMEKRYGGNLPKMWAAYNWGPGNVDKAIAKWGDRWLDHAPAETRNYVARNMRAVRGN